MKKVILPFALFIIAAIGASAQADVSFLRYAIPDYVIVSFDDGVYADVTKMELEYRNNNVIRYTNYLWEDEEWIKDGLILDQAFNAEMDVIRETYYSQTEEGELVPYYEYRFEYGYSYDRDGRVSEYTFGYGAIESSTWYQSPALSTIQYNDKGLRESALIYYGWADVYDHEEGITDYKAFYSYDDSDNITEEKRILYDGVGLQTYELYRYYYDTDGRISNMDFSRVNVVLGEEREPTLQADYDFYYNSVPIPEVKKNTDATVYISNENLVIRSTQAEEVSIYSVTGSKLCSVKKEAGEVYVSVSSLANQVLIVKGEGWTRKAAIY